MDKYDELIKRLLESKELKRMYDEYIIKDITFKEWVMGHFDNTLIWKGSQCSKSPAKIV